LIGVKGPIPVVPINAELHTAAEAIETVDQYVPESKSPSSRRLLGCGRIYFRGIQRSDR
jgi:hypothetical protein